MYRLTIQCGTTLPYLLDISIIVGMSYNDTFPLTLF
jgi:hypothetical protein